jgi:hypothetical protein
MKILYDAIVGSGANMYYGTMIVSNLRYEDGSAVNVSQYLSMTLDAPANVTGTDINPSFVSWVQVTAEVTSNQLDASNYMISANLAFEQAHYMDVRDQFTIGVNGDLTQNPDAYLNSFVIAADQSPDVNGTASVDCGASPDPALNRIPPSLTLPLAARRPPSRSATARRPARRSCRATTRSEAPMSARPISPSSRPW